MTTLPYIMHKLALGFALLATPLALFCLIMWLWTSPGWRLTFATLRQHYRKLTLMGRFIAIALLAVFLVKGSTKPNNQGFSSPTPPPAQQQSPSPPAPDPLPAATPPPPLRLSTNQYRAGFALTSVTTNAAAWAERPANAVTYERWTRYGVANDLFWLACTPGATNTSNGNPSLDWSYTLGTNQIEGIYIATTGTLSFNRPKGSPTAREMPDPYGISFMAPLQTHIGIVPPAGQFWHAITVTNTLLCTWQNVYYGRLAEYPISFQIELWPHGDFVYRYNLASLPNNQLFTDHPPPTTNFVIGAQHNHGGETYTLGNTNAVVHGLNLHWRAFGLLDPTIDDHDGDGLSTYDEVMLYGTNPNLIDTDGDGLSDYDEIFVYGTDPVEPQNYNIYEPDENSNGIIDFWEESGLFYGFVDSNEDGFDDRLEAQLPSANSNNVDVLVTVITSRSTALTWGNDALVLTAGTWRVRLRLPLNENTTVALKQPTTATGPWRAALSWQWHPERHDDVGLRIISGSTLFLQGQESDATLATILGAIQAPQPATAKPPAMWLTPYTQLYFLTGHLKIENPANNFCLRHQRGSLILQAKSAITVQKPLHWYYSDAQADTAPSGIGDTFAANRGGMVYCFENGGHPCTISKHLFDIGWVHIYDCGPPQTNILAAADLPDHTPVTLEETETIHHCARTNLNVYVGFGHNNVNTSNLVLIATHTEESYQRTQHCLGVVWAENGSLDLASLLADNAQPYLNKLKFTANGATVAGGILNYGLEPNDMRPTIFYIETVYKDNDNTLDRLWIVINSRDTNDEFDTWHNRNSSDVAWLETLPSPFHAIVVDNNDNIEDPEPAAPNLWEAPRRVRQQSFLHHDAVYEMRSRAIIDGHGHQATYNATGGIITVTIAAGTADFASPTSQWRLRQHIIEDVNPYIRALQLDGNPCIPNYRNDLNRPCLYEKTHVEFYFQVRPPQP